jgi:hypothetical protein
MQSVGPPTVPYEADPLPVYLELLMAPLIGNLSALDRERLREETEYHLERLQASYVLEGLNSEAALRKAIRSHGDPIEIAQRILEMHQNESLRIPALRRIGYGPFTAFVVFGGAQFFYTTLLQRRVFLPSGMPYHLPIAPGGARAIFPAPLPFPEDSSDLVLLYGLPIVLPILCGLVTGGLVYAHPMRATAFALLPLIVYSFVVGTLILPITSGLIFALFQVAFWVPLGCACAAFGSLAGKAFRTRREVRRFMANG